MSVDARAPVIHASEIASALRLVMDPELCINIVDLGMVYGITIHDGANVTVDLTLTSMSCPLWELFVDQVELALSPLDLCSEVNFVAQPPWCPDLMSPMARDELVAVGLIPPYSYRH